MAYLAQLVEINGLPLLSCLAVSGVLVYLGMHVIERKVIFVDLALAQIAALGVMWAILMGYDHKDDPLPVSLYSLAFTALGVLPVFAYLVIPAVAAAFLFQSVRARLIFGWAFAAAISLLGLETARLSELDPGPTIVCLFAAALVVLGVGLFLRAHRFAPRM